ncbi:MAG TPA: bifunctional tetrahydrofolate synthase/dihydrofolate synthase [Gammaproteobacteria bacterium]
MDSGQGGALGDWLRRLEGLHPRSIDLGLERVGRVHAALGAPRPARVVTVAGTNGKGSLVALLEAILAAAGYRVGAYTSPHLLRFNERVRIAGAEADDAALCAAFARVEAARGDTSLTYFEFTTLAALLLLAEAPLDVALLEVGLGGRLDAVNLVDPDVAVLTPIDLDHAEWLGNDRDSVGREKAGIMRSGVPAVLGDPDPPASVLACAAKLGAPLYRLGQEFRHAIDAHGWRWEGGGRVRSSLPRPALAGAHQYANAATALMALECLADRLPVGQDAVRRGLLEVRLPGRFQVVPGPVETVLDVAHNPHGARALAATLAARPCDGRTLAVVGMLADKALGETLAALQPLVHGWYLAPLEGPRGSPAARLATALGAVEAEVSRCADVADALARAHAAARPGDRVVVFGSFLTVAAALRADL